MKKILITGANSYIGVSFDRYMEQFRDSYLLDTLDVIGDDWKKADFSGYDALFHVAGIAHQKETAENAELYYKVNRDLAIQIAKKAKDAGVPHFVFMSTMSVYGIDKGVITPDKKPEPVTNYGKSKLEAEAAITQIADETFRVAVLRPPMVYGKGCRGNFQLLLRLVEKSPVFPVVENQRSMISILNLCSFVHMVIEKGCGGVFCPQNREYVNTTDMAKVMAEVLQRRVFFSKFVGLGIKVLIPVFSKARKAFSTLIYQDCEQFDFCYCKEDMSASVRNSI